MSSANSTDTLSAAVKPMFSITRKIRFGQTDPAGIVYYPNYFDMFNEIVEDWFADDLGTSFSELHQTGGLGIPIVQVECDFVRPCRLGEELTLQLTVTQLGSTSVHLQIAGLVLREVRIKASMVLVFVNLKTFCAVPPPESLRARIAQHLVEPAAAV